MYISASLLRERPSLPHSLISLTAWLTSLQRRRRHVHTILSLPGLDSILTFVIFGSVLPTYRIDPFSEKPIRAFSSERLQIDRNSESCKSPKFTSLSVISEIRLYAHETLSDWRIDPYQRKPAIGTSNFQLKLAFGGKLWAQGLRKERDQWKAFGILTLILGLKHESDIVIQNMNASIHGAPWDQTAMEHIHIVFSSVHTATVMEPGTYLPGFIEYRVD